jgi:hypothetical protein
MPFINGGMITMEITKAVIKASIPSRKSENSRLMYRNDFCIDSLVMVK